MSRSPLTHSHVVAGITHARQAADLARVDPSAWRVLSYTESAQLGGPQSFTITLPGRAALTTDGHRRPWRELLTVGDLIQAAGWNVDGYSTPQAVTMADGMITTISTRRNLAPGQYEYVTDLTCVGLSSVLLRDAVAWWMGFGTEDGWIKARAELLANDTSGRIDRMLANYMNKVVFHHAGWNRGGQGLGARLGYHFKALPPSAPISQDLAMAEGTHWSIMAQFTDDPLHQLYTSVRPASYAPQGGYAHKPTLTGEKAVIGQIAADGGRTWVHLRPAPFPFANADGSGNLSEWQALPLHDFSSDEALPLGGQGHDTSDSAIRNFFMVYPSYQFLDESMSFTAGIAVENRGSIERYSYSPLKVRTHLVLGQGAEQDMLTLARMLTWRIAAQWNHMEDYMSGSVVLPFRPDVQVGDRARYRDPGEDQTKPALMDAHIIAYTRSWDPDSGGQITLQTERVASAAYYADPKSFTRDLKPVQVKAKETAPTTKPTK